jgi:molybdopterin-synthase adenylyltransferase
MQDFARYAAQTRLPALGAEGQKRLRDACAVVVGVGATGCGIAEVLVRAGVGRVRVIDRDVIELGNLHRQVLYDEAAVASGLPKAEAAGERLRAINADVDVTAHVADLHAGNVLALLKGADVVFDGTDNFGARFLINDACCSLGTPWVYAGVVGTTVHGFPVVPGKTPCFRCYLDAVPPPGSTQTCDTAGVLGSAVLVASGIAATEGLKILMGRTGELAEGLFVFDTWTREGRLLGLSKRPDCPTCAGTFEHLEGEQRPPARLCGRDAVALPAPAEIKLDLDALAKRLDGLGQITAKNAFLLRFEPSESAGLRLTVFRDGRGLVSGTTEIGAARGLYSRYVGG